MPYDMVCLNQSHRKQCITYINNMFLRYLSLLQEFKFKRSDTLHSLYL